MYQKPSLKWGALVILLIAAGACSAPEAETEAFMDEFITAENQAQILEEAKKSLSYEEFELVKAYGKRVEPDLAEGQLPQGRTLSEILESQRAFEAAQLPPAEGSAPSEPPPAQAETPQSPKPPAAAAAPRAPAPAETKAVVSEPESVTEPEPAPQQTSGTLLARYNQILADQNMDLAEKARRMTAIRNEMQRRGEDTSALAPIPSATAPPPAATDRLSDEELEALYGQ